MTTNFILKYLVSARSAEEPKKRRIQTYPKNSGEHVGEFNQAYNLE